MRLVLASTNSAKLSALAERLGPGVHLTGLPAGQGTIEIPHDLEQGTSFAEIASAKATWYSRQMPSGLLVASDGGLLIPGLGEHWNPLHTSRFAGDHATGKERIGRLLEMTGEMSGQDRRIEWVEHLTVARDGQVLVSFIASGPTGLLATAPPQEIDAANGFWVPHIWCCPEFDGRRLSTLSEPERLSRPDHWALLGTQVTVWATNRPV